MMRSCLCVCAWLSWWLVCIWGGKYTRLGPPHSDLVSYVATNFSRLENSGLPPAGDYEPPEGWGQVEGAIAAIAHASGLVLDHQTACDGDCGPDSILRNLERLQLQNEHAQQILQVLQRKGRKAALRALRLKLLLWLRDNRAAQLLDGVSVEQWICFEPSYDSWEAYVASMRNPQVWFDTPMLYAASALFEAQLVVLLGSSDPQLIAATNVMSMPESPTFTIANVGKFRFYALHPEPSADSVVAASSVEEDLLLMGSEFDDEEWMSVPSVDECLPNVPLPQCPEAEPLELFDLCEQLSHWAPFACPDPQSKLADCIRRLEAQGSVHRRHAGAITAEVARWRSAVKLYQWEQHERQQGVYRDYEYQAGKRYHNIVGASTANCYKLGCKLGPKLDPAKLAATVSRPCGKHSRDHACFQHFQTEIGRATILRWRKLWYSLPKEDRMRRLIDMYAQNHRSQGQPDPNDFKMAYHVLGVPVCREAFMALTCEHANKLQAARKIALGQDSLPVASADCWVGRRPLAYQDARAWILDYARTHADSSPMCTKVFLPWGRRQFYWASYYKSRQDQKVSAERIAGYKYFCKVWRTELPWIAIKTCSGPFTHCGLCDYLKALVSAATDAGMKHSLLLRLGSHYDFQAAQRNAISLLFRESERDPSQLLCVSWDKMDQQKSIIPRVRSLANTQFHKGGSRIVVSLIGVLAPALFQNPVMYTVLEDQQHGSKMICSLMLDILREAVRHMGRLPCRLFVQADNTAKETKNTVALFCAVWTLIQFQNTRLQSIEFGYLLVGHTHDLIDAVFAFVGKALHGCDVMSLPQMFEMLQSRMKTPPLWKHLRDFWDFKAAQPSSLSASRIKGIGSPHHVRVYWAQDGSICLQCKRWLTSDHWQAPMVLVPAEDIANIRDIMPGLIQPRWDDAFANSCLGWLQRLRNLLQTADRDVSGIAHCEQLVRHELLDFLPSGETLAAIIGSMRAASLNTAGLSFDAFGALTHQIDQVVASSFPSYNEARPLIHLAGQQLGTLPFCEEALVDGMYIVYVNSVVSAGVDPTQIPIRLGRVLRVVNEFTSDPYVVVESMWPVRKDKNGGGATEHVRHLGARGNPAF